MGVWRADVLRRQVAAEVRGRSIRGVLAPLEPELVPAIGDEARDVDTTQELRRADERA